MPTKPLDQVLTREKALIFRITHRSNLGWIFRHGLHCSRSHVHDPGFVTIGNPDLIERRRSRKVPIPPKGTLGDYIPFYFTPSTPMLYNISTGFAGVRQQPNEEIVVLVTSLVALEDRGIRYVFTDRHAYLPWARFFADRDDLARVDYELLRRRDFQRDPEDPEKMERYQAEALVHEHLPVSAILGVCCYSHAVQQDIGETMRACGVGLEVAVRQGWYFG